MTAWLVPVILLGGVLQAAGSAMNAQLYRSLGNPWLASLVSFALIVALFLIMAAALPRPLPTADAVRRMPWWAPLGGLVGAVPSAPGWRSSERSGPAPTRA